MRDGKALANAYALIIFSGHHEYVTTHEYDVVTQLPQPRRQPGVPRGEQLLLEDHDQEARHDARRAVARPRSPRSRADRRAVPRQTTAAAIAGLDPAERRGERRRGSSPALNLEPGEGIASGGIEIDATSSASPQGIHVLAEIPNLYGPGFTAQMTYYETPAGAKVFAAGAFSLAASVWEPEVSTGS